MPNDLPFVDLPIDHDIVTVNPFQVTTIESLAWRACRVTFNGAPSIVIDLPRGIVADMLRHASAGTFHNSAAEDARA